MADSGEVAQVVNVWPVVLQYGTGVVRPFAVVVLWVELGEPHRLKADGLPCNTGGLDA